MDMNVPVPLPLLEDIFRLLEYLDDLGSRVELHFNGTGFSPRFEHDTALWELKLKIKRLQPRILDTYLPAVGDVTEYELHDLKRWVARGHCIYDNPYSICDVSGRTMDFINGCRAVLDMWLDLTGCYSDADDDGASGIWVDEDLPF